MVWVGRPGRLLLRETHDGFVEQGRGDVLVEPVGEVARGAGGLDALPVRLRLIAINHARCMRRDRLSGNGAYCCSARHGHP